MAPQLSPIFLGGTGRCGTTILREALRAHPGIAGFPFELRLFTDPGGLCDLVRDITDFYTPWRADAAVDRFMSLVHEMTSDNTSPPYARYMLDEWTDLDVYGLWTPLFHFLVEHQSDDTAWVGTRDTRRPFFEVPRPRFSELVDIIRGIVNEWYAAYTGDMDTHFVEDTPDNYAHTETLSEIWPDGAHVMCLRHPYDTAASYFRRRTKKRRWPSGDFRSNCRRLRSVYEVMAYEGTGYQIKLEELVENPVKHLTGLLIYVNVEPNHETIRNVMAPMFNPTRLVPWYEILDTDQQEIVAKELSDWCYHFGYAP